MTRVLITGFEPFNGATTNPSQSIAQMLDGEVRGDIEIVGRVLRVVFALVPDAISNLIEEVRPDVVIATGLAASDTVIRLEWFGANKIESVTPDNAGVVLQAHPIDLSGPAVRQSTIDLKNVAATLKKAKIPYRLSFNAGSHCCNLLLYTMLGQIEDRNLPIQAAFVHLPPEGAMPVEQMAEALRLVIDSLEG